MRKIGPPNAQHEGASVSVIPKHSWLPEPQNAIPIPWLWFSLRNRENLAVTFSCVVFLLGIFTPPYGVRFFLIIYLRFSGLLAEDLWVNLSVPAEPCL